MATGLLTIVCLMLLADPGRAEHGVPRDLARHRIEAASHRVERVARFLQGRVHGSFVHAGMTYEEVHRRLGGNACFFFIPSMTGSVTLMESYFQCGVNVFYRSDEGGELRVDEVTFYPLFGDVVPIFAITFEH